MNTPFPAVITLSAVLSLSLHGSATFQAARPQVEQHSHSYDGDFNPARQRPIASRKGGVEIRVVKAEPPCSKCFAALTLIINNHGTTRNVALEQPAQIDDIHIIDATKALIVGRNQAQISLVTLLDLSKGSVMDRFLCFKPAVSPDSARVAYVKMYPIHFMDDVSDEYLVYDTTQTPAQNRPPSIPTSDDTNVGIPLYPPGSANVPGDNLFGDARGIHHRMTSDGFFWSPDSRRLAFTDATPTNGLNMVVVADLSDVPHVSVPLTESAESIVECSGEFRGREIDAFVVGNIEFMSNTLRLSFTHRQCKAKKHSMTVALP